MTTQRRIVAWSAAAAAGLLAGCGGHRGYLLTPVPLERELQETVVRADPGWYSERIALLDLDGLIMNQRAGWFASGENPVSLLAEKLDRAADDKHVKAVVLRINSPGGTVQATEAMYGMIRRFGERTSKPVIACITDVGASGGYYLACSAEEVICQPSSITGSIGVVIQTVSFAGTMKMIGISAEAITSGKLKTMGSPLTDLGEDERKVFQAMVDEFYGRFVEVVASGRKGLDASAVRKLADGRVYTGRQALKLKLVDRLGGLPEAIAAGKAAAGIDRAKVVMYHRPLGYRANVYSSLPPGSPGTQINLVNIEGAELMLLRRPSFLYLWSTDLRPAVHAAP